MARPIGVFALAAAILAALAPGNVLAHENELPLPPNALPEVDLFTPDQRLNLSIPEGAILAHPPDQVRVDFRVDEFDLQPSSLELWIDGVEYTEQLTFWLGHATLLILTPDQFWGEGVHSIECSILDANGARFNRDIFWELIRPSCHPDCPWPIEPTGEPPVVANIMEDWQDFGSTPFYWHQGVDIRTPAGTEVYSVTDGTVVQVVNYKPTHSTRYLYWEVAVQDPSGFVWQYHHIDSTTIAVSMGAAVNAGDLLGNIVAWEWYESGELYHHLHMNVVRWTLAGPVPGPYIDGWDYYNPFEFMADGSYMDSVDPVNIKILFSHNQADSAFAADSDPLPPILQDDVDILARLEEEMTPIGTGLGQPYILGVYDLAYEVKPLDATRCGRGTIPRTRLVKFDKLPGPANRRTRQSILQMIYKRYAYLSFSGGMFYEGTDHGSRFGYPLRRFTYSMTNGYFGAWDPILGVWDTAVRDSVRGPLYPDGNYEVTVHATDYFGNSNSKSVEVEIDNGIPYVGLCPRSLVMELIGQVESLHPALGVATSPFGPVPMDFGAGLATRPGNRPRLRDVPVAVAMASPPGTSLFTTVEHTDWPVMVFDYSQSGLQFAVGMLEGEKADVEYVPVLGDLVIHAPAEMQVLQPGESFNPQASSSNPVDLRFSTRLARDPSTGDPIIGSPVQYGGVDLEMAMAVAVGLTNVEMVIRTEGGDAVPGTLHSGQGSVGPGGISDVRPTPRLRVSPNPAARDANLNLTLGQPAHACLDIVDASGRRIRQLGCRMFPTGDSAVRWDGRNDRGARVSSGVYFARLRGDRVDLRAKLVILNR